MRCMKKNECLLAAGLVFGLSGSLASAAFVTPQSWTRGTGGATYQAWDIFDTYPTDSTPDVGNVNANGTASLTENTGGAFVTSGGNIYSFSTATDFTVTIPEADVPTPAHDVTAVVQIKTQGTEIDPATLLLNGQAPVESVELDRVVLGGFGGSLVENWYLFNVPYAAFGDGVPGVEDLTLTFGAQGSSMSLDAISIDTAIRPFGYYAEPTPAAIPEPATAALLSLGGLALLRRRA